MDEDASQRPAQPQAYNPQAYQQPSRRNWAFSDFEDPTKAYLVLPPGAAEGGGRGSRSYSSKIGGRGKSDASGESCVRIKAMTAGLGALAEFARKGEAPSGLHSSGVPAAPINEAPF